MEMTSHSYEVPKKKRKKSCQLCRKRKIECVQPSEDGPCKTCLDRFIIECKGPVATREKIEKQRRKQAKASASAASTSSIADDGYVSDTVADSSVFPAQFIHPQNSYRRTEADIATYTGMSVHGAQYPLQSLETTACHLEWKAHQAQSVPMPHPVHQQLVSSAQEQRSMWQHSWARQGPNGRNRTATDPGPFGSPPQVPYYPSSQGSPVLQFVPAGFISSPTASVPTATLPHMSYFSGRADNRMHYLQFPAGQASDARSLVRNDARLNDTNQEYNAYAMDGPVFCPPVKGGGTMIYHGTGPQDPAGPSARNTSTQNGDQAADY